MLSLPDPQPLSRCLSQRLESCAGGSQQLTASTAPRLAREPEGSRRGDKAAFLGLVKRGAYLARLWHCGELWLFLQEKHRELLRG